MAPSLHLAFLKDHPNYGSSATGFSSSLNNHTAQSIFSRAIGFSSTDNITCARPLDNLVGDPVFKGGSLTFHTLMVLISAPCLAVTILSTIFLCWRHLHHYTAPQEQRQILRIIWLPVGYSLFNFLALCFYQDYLYIEPIAGIYEAFTVAALFLLILEYVCPDGMDREKYFNELPGQDKKGRPQPGGSLKWFNQTFSSTMQYPLSKLVFVVIQIVTQYYGVYCENSFSPKYAHLWLFLADILLIGGALGAAVRFARRMRTEITPEHRRRPKVISFIGIIAFQIIQGIVFHLLNGKLFSPTKTVTYNDINFGIPSFMTCIEAIIFSLIFQWSFSVGEYKKRQDRYGTGPATRTKTFKAILDALNLSDIVIGTVVAFQLIFMRVQTRYGAARPSQQGQYKSMDESETHLEPLSDRQRMRGYSNASDQYSPPLETSYEASMGAPPMPEAARDPSPAGHARTFRADNLRPGYEPLRAPSPSGVPPQEPRAMY